MSRYEEIVIITPKRKTRSKRRPHIRRMWLVDFDTVFNLHTITPRCSGVVKFTNTTSPEHTHEPSPCSQD